MENNEELLNNIEELESQVADLEVELEAQERQTMAADDAIAEVELALDILRSELDEAEESVIKVDSAKDLISDFYFGRGNLYNDMLLEVNRIDGTKHKQKKQYLAGFTDAIDALSREIN